MPIPAPAARTDGLSPDLDIVARIRAGDMHAMETLMRRHNRTLFRTARAILLDDAEAEEAVQDAYLRAYGALDGSAARRSCRPGWCASSPTRP
jgi:RNA polymerase sigma-70 factor, ECF subfamily